jgi:hypothetical protein
VGRLRMIYWQSFTSVNDLCIFGLEDATLVTQLIKNCVFCQVKTHLEENGIEIKEYSISTVKASLAEVTKQSENSETNKSVNGKHQTVEKSSNLIWADPASCCYALYSKLNPDAVVLQQSPLALPKALKVVSCMLILLYK